MTADLSVMVNGPRRLIDLSVVIPTWNNGRRLAITLDAVARCRVPGGLRWEVVLVDNGCTDDTVAVIIGWQDRLPLVHVREPRQGASRARNRGIEAARGELLLFADDDVTPCLDWIALYWAAWQRLGNRVYLGGPVYSEFEAGVVLDEELLAVANRTVKGYDHGPRSRALSPGDEFLESNWACAASAIRAVGGYDPNLGLDASLGRRRIGEGPDLQRRLVDHGLSPQYLADAIVHHHVPQSKCTIGAIGASYFAQGVYIWRRPDPGHYCRRFPWLASCLDRDRSPIARGGLTMASTGLAVLRWLGARLLGRKGYGEYVTLQFCLGMVRGGLERAGGRDGH